MKRYRWICPVCRGAVLAPARMSRRDPRRYCEPCSKRLFLPAQFDYDFRYARRSPVLDREREQQARRRKRASKQSVTERQARRGFGPGPDSIEAWFATILDLWDCDVSGATLRIRYKEDCRGSMGYAKLPRGLVVLSAGLPQCYHNKTLDRGANKAILLALLVHEAAHIVCQHTHGVEKDAGGRRIIHGINFKRTLIRGAEALIQDGIEVPETEPYKKIDAGVTRQIYQWLYPETEALDFRPR